MSIVPLSQFNGAFTIVNVYTLVTSLQFEDDAIFNVTLITVPVSNPPMLLTVTTPLFILAVTVLDTSVLFFLTLIESIVTVPPTLSVILNVLLVAIVGLYAFVAFSGLIVRKQMFGLQGFYYMK